MMIVIIYNHYGITFKTKIIILRSKIVCMVKAVTVNNATMFSADYNRKRVVLSS